MKLDAGWFQVQASYLEIEERLRKRIDADLAMLTRVVELRAELDKYTSVAFMLDLEEMFRLGPELGAQRRERIEDRPYRKRLELTVVEPREEA